MKGSLFSREPLAVSDGIPVFSAGDGYTENYETIAGHHLAALAAEGVNPFIAEHLWVEMEGSTAGLLGRYGRAGDAVLDIGVGLGRVLAQFPSFERHGMDISLGYLKEARAKGIAVCFSRVEDMPYREGVFDLVLCTDVLEHVPDLDLACRRALEVLKPGGLLLVRVPYREDLGPYLAPDYPYPWAHLRAFDEHSLRLLFERVHHCTVEEVLPACWPSPHRPYPSSRFKCALRFRGRDRLLSLLFTLVRLGGRRSHDRLLRALYHPIEINIVVRKP